MFIFTEQYYLEEFIPDYDVDPRKILKIMRKCEKEQDPEDFDFNIWESSVREKLSKLCEE